MNLVSFVHGSVFLDTLLHNLKKKKINQNTFHAVDVILSLKFLVTRQDAHFSLMTETERFLQSLEVFTVKSC